MPDDYERILAAQTTQRSLRAEAKTQGYTPALLTQLVTAMHDERKATDGSIDDTWDLLFRPLQELRSHAPNAAPKEFALEEARAEGYLSIAQFLSVACNDLPAAQRFIQEGLQHFRACVAAEPNYHRYQLAYAQAMQATALYSLLARRFTTAQTAIKETIAQIEPWCRNESAHSLQHLLPILSWDLCSVHLADTESSVPAEQRRAAAQKAHEQAVRLLPERAKQTPEQRDELFQSMHRALCHAIRHDASIANALAALIEQEASCSLEKESASSFRSTALDRAQRYLHRAEEPSVSESALALLASLQRRFQQAEVTAAKDTLQRAVELASQAELDAALEAITSQMSQAPLEALNPLVSTVAALLKHGATPALVLPPLLALWKPENGRILNLALETAMAFSKTVRQQVRSHRPMQEALRTDTKVEFTSLRNLNDMIEEQPFIVYAKHEQRAFRVLVRECYDMGRLTLFIAELLASIPNGLPYALPPRSDFVAERTPSLPGTPRPKHSIPFALLQYAPVLAAAKITPRSDNLLWAGLPVSGIAAFENERWIEVDSQRAHPDFRCAAMYPNLQTEVRLLEELSAEQLQETLRRIAI